MANNRMYLVDTETEKYIPFAKTMLDGWYGLNHELIESFMNQCLGENQPIIVDENSELYDKYINPENEYKL